MKKNNLNFIFFGSSRFSVFCLEELKTSGFLPSMIISTPDQPTGRGLTLTSTPVKKWAENNEVICLTPAKLNEDFLATLAPQTRDIFLVASYGKIVPKKYLEVTKYGTLNIHPSLLPKYRGASPLQTQILNDEKNIGTSIMLMDEEIDHGPIIVQKQIEIKNWPPKLEELKKVLAKESVVLFIKIIDDWVAKKIETNTQNHSQATFTKKIEKAAGLIDIIADDPYKNFLKIQAYSLWPEAYFLIKKNDQQIRVKVKEAEFKNNTLIIKRVLPEGKKEMNYEDFLRGLK